MEIAVICTNILEVDFWQKMVDSYQFQDCVEVLPLGYLTLLEFTQMAEVAQKKYLMTSTIPNTQYLFEPVF